MGLSSELIRYCSLRARVGFGVKNTKTISRQHSSSAGGKGYSSGKGKGNFSGKASAWEIAVQPPSLNHQESVFIEQVVKAASALRTASAFARSAATAFDAEANNLDAVVRRLRGETVGGVFA